jgi:4'-phosphopantetheinyl transferase EntD
VSPTVLASSPRKLRSILPFDAVVISESELEDTETPPLPPAEHSALAKIRSEKRRREFRAGRQCARRALAELGIRDFSLLPATDRAPVWPVGVIGSITHTEDDRRDGGGYCGVAVARATEVQGIGIDAEPAVALPSDLWKRVLDDEEHQFALGMPDPGLYARFVFSAKEAVYKAVYPIVRQFLDFSDVHIESASENGLFTAHLSGFKSVSDVSLTKLLGRFVIEQSLIMTAIVLTAESLQLARQRMP